LKRLYKRCTPWKLRYLLHGLVGGAAHGLQTAWNDFNASVHAVRTVVDVVEELPILPDVVQTLAAADADLYIAPGVSEVAAMTAWYARSSRHPYVMLAGSDRDFSPNILNDPDGRDAHGRPHALLRYVIRSAARHIVQNTNQLELARAFDVSAVLVPNPIDLAPDYPAQPGARQVLWVGNTEQTVKQPQIMLELARRLPEYEFVMIITPIQPDAYAQIEQAAGRLPNLTVCSRIPYRQVEQYFARARCLVNTSVYEGLPNTFLQAGKYRVPLLSLNVDPNGMLTQHNCGLLCGGDLQRLESHLRNLMTDDALHGQLGTNLHAYVQEHHDQHKIIAQVEAIFRSALDQYAQVNR
ncbi:MAG: glycosyltransferase family 4 protein, partial [Chloroflexota bacterium]